MYTARELIQAVKERKTLKPLIGNEVYHTLNTAIIEQANKGWLCINATKYELITNDLKRYYTDLGYQVEDGIIYWIWN